LFQQMTEDFVFNIKSLPLIFIRVLPLQKGEKEQITNKKSGVLFLFKLSTLH